MRYEVTDLAGWGTFYQEEKRLNESTIRKNLNFCDSKD